MKTNLNSEFESYNQEVNEKWGNTAEYKEYAEKSKNYTKDKWDKINLQMNNIISLFSECLKSGTPTKAFEVQSLVETLKNHITENYYNCTNEVLSGLGKMYVADERFKNNIDKNGEGTAEYIREAIEVYCGR